MEKQTLCGSLCGLLEYLSFFITFLFFAICCPHLWQKSQCGYMLLHKVGTVLYICCFLAIYILPIAWVGQPHITAIFGLCISGCRTTFFWWHDVLLKGTWCSSLNSCHKVQIAVDWLKVYGKLRLDTKLLKQIKLIKVRSHLFVIKDGTPPPPHTKYVFVQYPQIINIITYQVTLIPPHVG